MTGLETPDAIKTAANVRHRAADWRPRPTLGRDDYVSPEVWAEERERLWFGGWVCIGRAAEIANAGEYLVRDLVGESIVVLRHGDGRPRAFYNVCSHRGTRLLDGAPGEAYDCGRLGKAMKCPYHAWAFDLDGRLIGTPNVHEDEAFDRSAYPLHAIRVDELGGFLFVNLADDGPTLAESLGAGVETIVGFERYGLDELRVARRLVYEVAANWKLIAENYNECLHCPTVHPELVKLVPLYRMGEVWDGEAPDGGNWMADGASSFTLTGTSGLPTFPGLRDDDRRLYYGILQFPNLFVNLHPDAVMTYRLEPLALDRTRVVTEFLFRSEAIAADGFDPAPVVELWDLISRQDWAIVERAQLGVRSRAYARGGVFPRQDRLVFDFTESWRAAMGRPLLG